MAPIQSKLSLEIIPQELLDYEETDTMLQKAYLEGQQNEDNLMKTLFRKASKLKSHLQDKKKQNEVKLINLKTQLKHTAKEVQESKKKEFNLCRLVDEKKKLLSAMNIQCISDDDLLSYRRKLNDLINVIELQQLNLKTEFKRLSFAVSLYKRELCCNVTVVGNNIVKFSPNIYGLNEYIILKTNRDASLFECVEVSSQILDPKLIDEYKKRKDILGLVMVFMKLSLHRN